MAKFKPTIPSEAFDRVQLLVGQIARYRAERMDVGMGGDQGSVAYRGHIPEAFFIHVRQIDQDAEFVAAPDEPLASVGQAGSDIGR